MILHSAERSTKALLATAVVAAMLLLGGRAALADQNDPALDSLFGRLLTTHDFVEALTLTKQIWQHWNASHDAVANRDMADGINAMKAEDLPKALKAFNKVVKRAPKFAEGWNKRATVYYMMGRYDDSLADVARALELEPRHFGALSGRGLIYLREGKEGEALKAFDDALATNPFMPAIQERAARLRDELKDGAI